MAATLSGGSELPSDPNETTATIEFTSDSDEGTVYAAARKSSAYQTGDEAIIKSGAGADWSGSIASPVTGANTFNLTGLDDDIANYHCGVVQETVVATFSYELNVLTQGAGVFTVTRASNGITLDDSGAFRSVGANKPLLMGGSHNGTDFSAPCQGLLAHASSTNTVVYSGGEANTYRDYWNYLTVNVSDIAAGEGYFCRGAYGAAPTDARIEKGADGASHPGPWVWEMYVREGTAPGFTLEINNGRGSAIYLWQSGVPVVDELLDSAVSWAYEVAAGTWCIVFVVSGTSNQWKTLRFYPTDKWNAPLANVYTDFFGGHLIDSLYPAGVIYPTTGSAITTDDSRPEGSLSNMGVPDITGDFSLHFKGRSFHDNTGYPGTRYLFSFLGDTNNRINLIQDGGTNTLKLAIRVGGTATSRSMKGIAIGADFDLRIKFDTASGNVTAWLDGTKYTFADAGNFGTALSKFRLSTSTDAAPAEGDVCPLVMTGFKLHDSALDDAVIEGWT